MQANVPMDERYDNAWDDPSGSSSFFRAPGEYRPMPSSVGDWYGAVTRGASRPDPSSFDTRFPWEKAGDASRPPATRAFPRAPSPPKPAQPVVDVSPAKPTARSSGSRPYTYENAWDSVVGIRKYVDELKRQPTRPPNASSPLASAASSASGATASTSRTTTPISASAASAAMLGADSSRHGDAYARGGEASSRDGDDEDEEDEDPDAAARRDQVPKLRAPVPASAAAVARARPWIRRNDGSLGSMNRLPTLGSDVVVDTGAVVPPEFASTSSGATSPPRHNGGGSGSGKHSRLSSISSATTTTGPLSPTLSLTPTGTATSTATSSGETSRVFNDSTDLAKVKAEGLAALNRFVSASTNGTGSSTPTARP